MNVRPITRFVIVAALAAGCSSAGLGRVTPPGAPPPPVSAPPPAPAPAPKQTLAVNVVAADGAPVIAHVSMGEQPARLERETDGAGHVEFNLTPGPRDFIVTADGYVPQHIEAFDNSCFGDPPCSEVREATVTLQPAHLDPTRYTLAELAAIRGAMWPTANLAGLPFGPRPDDPTNIISTGSWHCYTTAQRDQIAASLRARGYTHVAYGPVGTPDNGSYHGQYCATPDDWSTFLDDLEDLWDRGFIPIVFVKPDNWTFAQTDAYFRPLIDTPRARRLLRIVVPAGWEPWGYNASSCTWAQFIGWARELLPDALILMHNATKADGSPYDGPVGGDALCDDNGHPNGEGWVRVFNAGLDGWLIQTGPATTPPEQAPNRREWCAMFQADGDGATFHSIGWHFAKGIGGFPTVTKRGNKFLLYGGEITAFAKYWGRLPEAAAEAWGDEAMRCGADGYFDSGTIAVPTPEIRE